MFSPHTRLPRAVDCTVAGQEREECIYAAEAS